MHFLSEDSGRVEMKVNGKRRYSKKLAAKGLEIPCMFSVLSEHEKMSHRFEEYVKGVLSKKRKQY